MPYLDLNQKLDILNRNSRAVATGLLLEPSVVKKLTEALRGIGPIRNRVCHPRPLEEEDLPVILDTTRALLADIEFPFDGLAREYQLLRANQYPYVLAIPEFWRTSQQRIVENLPDAEFDDTGYIGRERDRQNLLQLLMGPHPVITVTGEGGIGKTALTVRCLYDLVDQEEAPYEAILFGSLKSDRLTSAGIRSIVDSAATEIDVLRPLLALFDKVGEEVSQEHLYEGIVRLLETFRVLLVVDNIETIDLDALRPLLIRIPRGSKVVLTSRIGIGEIEIRYPLDPLQAGDAIRLFRRLARVLNMVELGSRDDAQIAQICERLYFNPLLIRWFVEGYSEGKSIPELLNTRKSMAVVLDFCFKNVYSRFNDVQRKILQTLVIVPGPLSEVQIALLNGIRNIDEVRLELQYLYASNVVRRAADLIGNQAAGTLWVVTDFARRYVNAKDNRPIQERQRLIREYRALITARDQARLRAQLQAFSTNVIAARSTDEATVVRLLWNAQTRATGGGYDEALRFVNEARELQPGFYEVWRVSAQIKDLSGDIAGAYDDFQRATDLAEGKSEALLAFYSQFLRKQNDFDGALEVLRSHAEKHGAAPQLRVDYAWLHVLTGNPAQASRLFQDIEPAIAEIGGREQIHYVTQYASALRRAADAELQRRSPLQAEPYSLRALQLIERWSSQLLIDPGLVREAQRCVQTAARVIAGTRGLAMWNQLVPTLRALALALPLVGEMRSGLAALEDRCPDIAATDDYRQIFGVATGQATHDQVAWQGSMKPVYDGREYGFVGGLDGRDYFVHRSEFIGPGRWEELWGQGSLLVEFVPGEQTAADKAPRARAVRLVRNL
jgi:LuxR family glucitol operon transcriptional activator